MTEVTIVIEEFFDRPVKAGEPIVVGRAWKAEELRRKSFDDLHKLWYVLYKERNMLQTEKVDANKRGGAMIAPSRMRKVRLSMTRLKHVLHERQRDLTEMKAAAQLESEEMLNMIESSSDGGHEEVTEARSEAEVKV